MRHMRQRQSAEYDSRECESTTNNIFGGGLVISSLHSYSSTVQENSDTSNQFCAHCCEQPRTVTECVSLTHVKADS